MEIPPVDSDSDADNWQTESESEGADALAGALALISAGNADAVADAAAEAAADAASAASDSPGDTRNVQSILSQRRRRRRHEQRAAAEDDSELDAAVVENDHEPNAAVADDQPLVDITRRLVIENDPLEVLKRNDLFRKYTTVEDDLWTIDQWVANVPQPYICVASTTFIPRIWPTAKRVTQLEYNTQIMQRFEILQSILPIPHVYVAGGAAAWPLGESNVKNPDIDLFIVGIPPDDKQALWTTIAKIAKRVRTHKIENTNIYEFLSTGLLTFSFIKENYFGPRVVVLKVQVILRAFPSVSSLLHGFDVPSCCIAFDGRHAYMTYLAAWAHTFRANIVNPDYRSTSYESRLVKYFDRKYALVLPFLSCATLVAGQSLRLPHLVLKANIVKDRFAVGTVELSSIGAVSDYETAPLSDSRITEYTAYYSNVRRLASDTPQFMSIDHWNGHKFARFRKLPHSLGDLVQREQLVKMLAQHCKSIVNVRTGKFNIKLLHSIFRLSAAQIDIITHKLLEIIKIYGKSRRIDLTQTLRPMCDALLAKYDALQTVEIDWWITQDPSRQYTVSLNPRMEHPTLWYGEYYHELEAANLLDSVLASLYIHNIPTEKMADAVFDGQCSICFGPITRGDVNSIILACGHIFHWAPNAAGCGGFVDWSENSDECPVCRRHTVFEDTLSDRWPVVPSIDVILDLGAAAV